MSNPEETRIPAPEEALPGRSEPAYEIEERHAVLGTPLRPPFPEGAEVAYFALAVTGPASSFSGRSTASTRPPSAT
jgi:hypothetical protein